MRDTDFLKSASPLLCECCYTCTVRKTDHILWIAVVTVPWHALRSLDLRSDHAKDRAVLFIGQGVHLLPRKEKRIGTRSIWIDVNQEYPGFVPGDIDIENNYESVSYGCARRVRAYSLQLPTDWLVFL